MINSPKIWFWIIVVTALACSVLIGGIYETSVVATSGAPVTSTTNRFTGDVRVCIFRPKNERGSLIITKEDCEE